MRVARPGGPRILMNFRGSDLVAHWPQSGLSLTMRSALAILVLAASSLGSSAAFAQPPTPPPVSAPRPAPPSPVKVVRPPPEPEFATPTVSVNTAKLAAQHDAFVKSDAKQPIPRDLKVARREVQARDNDYARDLIIYRAESGGLALKAQSLLVPIDRTTHAYSKPTPEMLAQASSLYADAARTLVRKAGSVSERTARANPDAAAKTTAAKELAADYVEGARHYRSSADAQDKRAAALTAEGKLPEAAAAREKAEHTRGVAVTFETRAAAVEKNGVPGADALTLPDELTLSH